MRKNLSLLTMLGVVALALGTAAQAQVIQLPSQRIFTSDGSVLIPDGGNAPAAGVKRGAGGSSASGGLPASRATGAGQTATGQRVTATMHDPQAADARLAGQAPAPVAGAFSQRAAKTKLALPAGDPGLKSVAEHQRDRQAREATDEQEAKRLLEQARAAQADGKANVAVEYYRQAAKRASGPLKQTIEAESAAMQASAAKAGPAKQQKPAPSR